MRKGGHAPSGLNKFLSLFTGLLTVAAFAIGFAKGFEGYNNDPTAEDHVKWLAGVLWGAGSALVPFFLYLLLGVKRGI